MKKIIILWSFICSILVLSGQMLSLQTGHSSQINDVKFTRNNEYLISCGDDYRVIIWDLRTMMQMRTCVGHTNKVNSIAVSPIDNIFATASDDKSVILWEYPSGRKIKTYSYSNEVKSVAFSPDGKTLACGSDSVYLINLETQNIRTIGKKANKFYNALAFSPNGVFLAFGGKKEFYTYVYSWDYNHLVKKIIARSASITFSEDNKLVITAGINGSLKIRGINDDESENKRSINVDNYQYSFGDVVVRDSFLLAACSNSLLYLYNVSKDFERIDLLKQTGDKPTTVDISFDGVFAASAGKNAEIYIWNLKSLTLIKVLKSQLKSINSIDFSQDGNLLFIAYSDGSAKMWDLKNKTSLIYNNPPELNFVQKYFDKHYSAINGSKVNPNKVFVRQHLNEFFRISNQKKSTIEKLILWDIANDGTNIALKNSKKNSYRQFFPIDSSKIVELVYEATHLQENSVWHNTKIIDRQQVFKTTINTWLIHKPLKSKKFKTEDLYLSKKLELDGDTYFAEVSDSGNFVIVLQTEKDSTYCQIWDIELNYGIARFSMPSKYQQAKVDNLGKYAVFIENNRIHLYDIDKQNLIEKFQGTSPAVFSPNSEYLSFADTKGNVCVYSLKQNKLVYCVPTFFQTEVTDIKFNHPYKYIAAASYDGLIKLWNLETGGPIVNIASFGQSDFIYINKDNYYYATKNAIQNIAFLMNDQLFTFEQFDMIFNRPDTIFSTLPYAEPKEVDIYKKIHKKRLQKMKYAATTSLTNLNIPKIKVLNIDSLPITTPYKNIKINLVAWDSLYNIKNINIWINNVPIFGEQGFVVSDKTKKYTGVFDIELNSGMNYIDISATNIKGVESFKKSISIYCEQKTDPTMYIIAIGISKYQDTTLRLKYASKDANDLVNLFLSNKIYKNKVVIKLTDEQANLSNILKLKYTLKQTKVDDLVVLFYAGHGMLDNFYNYYLPLCNFSFNNFFETAIAYDDFINLLDSIPARQKIAFIDACHSGEFDKSEQITDILSKNQQNNTFGERSLWRSTQSYYFTQSTFEMMKSIFADLRRGNGAVVISSASAQEYAYESDYLQNGVFTYLLIDAIKNKRADFNKDNALSITELQRYITTTMPQITRGKQNPTSRQENIKNDFVLWQYNLLKKYFNFAKK